MGETMSESLWTDKRGRVEPYVMVHNVPGSSIHSERPIKVVSLAEYDRLRVALEKIADREPDLSSVNQTAFFWTWAKEVAEEALRGR
jgi:hypothetical protein